MPALEDRARQYLRIALSNPNAEFHDDQWEAIHALVEDRARLLVVQRTGWGKSMVYFLATRLLRDGGAGPTLIISPLLALMRNQIAAAGRIGIRATTINSANRDEWDAVEAKLLRNEVDVLLISPERLSNQQFRENVLSRVAGRIGMFVVDEAHCISDWGHDFRPDYRRIVRVVQAMPPNLPVLATTATANDRVVKDVVDQLGDGLHVIRGPLARESLRLQAIEMNSQAERMAWLAKRIPEMDGSGIVYVRTIRDAKLVATWLRENGIRAQEYHSGTEEREQLEDALLQNEVKALVATSALGMGFDKPDLAFVIHYQRPGSVVEYYQQVGRAGRNGADAYGILLSGAEDDEITDYFIRTASPPDDHIVSILDALENAENGLRLSEIEEVVNLSRSQILKVLKNLDVESPSPVARVDNRYYRTATPYAPDHDRIRTLSEIRHAEQAELKEYMQGEICHMAYLRMKLDDVNLEPCGRCAVDLRMPLLSVDVDEELVRRAIQFMKRSYRRIPARRRSPEGKFIPEELLAEEGRSLCIYGDAGWGRLVQRGKYQEGAFDDQLVDAVAEMIESHWHPEPAPSWLTCIASNRHPELVPSFARRLADQIGLPFVEVITKIRDTEEQKKMNNSHHRRENLRNAFVVEVPPEHHDASVFLVDDVVDSRWTFTHVAALLRKHGAGRVFPVALAESTSD